MYRVIKLAIALKLIIILRCPLSMGMCKLSTVYVLVLFPQRSTNESILIVTLSVTATQRVTYTTTCSDVISCSRAIFIAYDASPSSAILLFFRESSKNSYDSLVQFVRGRSVR